MRAELRQGGHVPALTWPGLAEFGVDAFVTTRDGGVSSGPYRSLNLGLHVGDDPEAVVENRRRAAQAMGADLRDCVVATQVHGTRAVVVTADDAGRGATRAGSPPTEADALVTRTAGPVLVTLVADCSPILLVDPVAGVLATVHAGWRGAVHGAPAAAVGTMETLGARPERTVALIGPTIPPGAYEVGDEVAVAARARFGGRAADVLAEWDRRWRFDVAEANRLDLLSAGLPERQVHRTGVGTDDERFFSDRAERPCGRFALLARLR